jgi:fibronectin type 3 domain-containing protein
LSYDANKPRRFKLIRVIYPAKSCKVKDRRFKLSRLFICYKLFLMNKKQKQKLRQKLGKTLERSVIGYHVYRSEKEDLPFMFWARMTDEPIPESTFSDPAAEVGKRYFYKLTQVFSDGKESAPITPKSTYTDHAGKTFEQNPLADFAGYNIYRSIDQNVPLDKWERRNSAPLPTTEFKDEGVESGEIYFYYVRAVDSKGAESSPSHVTRVIRK